MKCYLGLAAGLLTIEVRTEEVILSNSGRAVVLRTGSDVEPDMRIMKLPIPIQKAMASPAANPVTAP